MARPNLTAIKVARVTVFLGDHELVGPLLPEGAAELSKELLLERGHLRPWMLRFYEKPGRRAWLERTGDRFSPGQTVRVGLRKRFMDDELRAAIEAGATQVLAIGAGYDTTCLRLAAQFEDCRFVEIDQPGTLEDKRAGIEAIGRARPNLELVAADLAKTPLAEVLAKTGWDAGAPSVIVAEGVLMYLPEAAVAGFFEAAHGLCGPNSRLLFTYMTCDAKGRPRAGNAAWLTRASLKLMGHAWQWCVADEDALARFVAERGWCYEPDPERFDLAARYLVPLGRDDRERAAPLEFMAVVERGS